jgi:hypothetical protein
VVPAAAAVAAVPGARTKETRPGDEPGTACRRTSFGSGFWRWRRCTGSVSGVGAGSGVLVVVVVVDDDRRGRLCAIVVAMAQAGCRGWA